MFCGLADEQLVSPFFVEREVHMDTSDLAKRMKEYEKAGQRYLTRRMPVLLRLDGSHFTGGKY